MSKTDISHGLLKAFFQIMHNLIKRRKISHDESIWLSPGNAGNGSQPGSYAQDG